MSTAIAAWGNSSAVRIPQNILQIAGLKRGDRVNLEVNDHGNIELIKEDAPHRRVSPAKGVTFEALTKGFDGSIPPSSDYWNVSPIGAEKDVWE